MGQHDDADGGAATPNFVHGDGVGEGIKLRSVVVDEAVDSHQAQFCLLVRC